MKKILMVLVLIILTFKVSAQSPDKMSYQCIVRNSSGALVTNQNIGFRISILQGSASGTVVYQEIYNPNPQTNANGLVNMEIGSGIALIGTFASIDWSSGEYFLKTETDPTGGTNYTISGTTQLLSVPYAMYAKTAGNGFSGNYFDLTNKPALFSGNFNDLLNKPTFFNGSWADITGKPTTIVDYGITDAFNGTWNNLTGKPTFATVATSGNYNDLSNIPAITGGETKIMAGTNTTVTGEGTQANPYIINSTVGGGNHYIGEHYGGGIVYYVYDNGQHGLIAAEINDQYQFKWDPGTSVITPMAYADGIGAGRKNTSLIIASQGLSDGISYAARICSDYQVTVDDVTYGDWYLPSIYELRLLAMQKDVVGGFASFEYWSSTEFFYRAHGAFVFGISFANYGSEFYTGKHELCYVRPIRSF